jgi:serralysin
VGGTLTGYSATYNGGLVYTATGLSVAAATAYQLIQSNNVAQLEAVALSGADTIYGAGDGDILVGFGGNNTIIGVQSGADYAAYSGAASAYTVTVDATGFLVSRPDGGQDQLINIKAVEFSNQTDILTSSGGIISGPATDSPVINQETVGIFRFFNNVDGTHFYTTSTSEALQIASSRPDLVFEGIGMDAINPSNLGADPQAVPVFRFFDSLHGTQFLTISQSEEQTILNTRPDLKLEGVAFYAHSTQQSGDAAVYRFFDSGNGTHFYTDSLAERAQILASRPDLKLEGVAFYVPTT